MLPKCYQTRQEGLEPPTYGLEIRCSIQLSYWRIIHVRKPGIIAPPIARIKPIMAPLPEQRRCSRNFPVSLSP
jgi:hypothetical protein